MSALARHAGQQAQILYRYVALLWVLELLDLLVLHGGLDRFGIRPRDPNGLVGVLFAPLLHGGIGHLLANTVPLVVLGWLVMVRRLSDFFAVTAIVWLLGGLGVWLLAPPRTIHIGASGLIFGYLGFLLLRGYFERSFGAILVSVVVGLLYGSAIWGILPSRPGISWQGHLFGFLAGIVAAWLLAAPRSRRAALSGGVR
jgi:membrane associated rhomboid family serine protease